MYGVLGLAFAGGVVYALYIGQTTAGPAVTVVAMVVLPCAALCVYLWGRAAAAPRTLRYVFVAMGLHVGVVALFSLPLAAMLLVPMGVTFVGMRRWFQKARVPPP
jgi:hypothetical protein